MIIEGLKLMVLGMGVVFIFLILLYVIVAVMAILLKSTSQVELAATTGQSMSTNVTNSQEAVPAVLMEDSRIAAAITAAVAHHRRKTLR